MKIANLKPAATFLILLIGVTASAWAKPCKDSIFERDKPCRVTAAEGGTSLGYLAATAACCAGALFLRRRRRIA